MTDYLKAPEIEIDGVVIPQFTVMQLDMGVDNHFNRVSLVGSFGYGEGLASYIEPTLEGSRKEVNIKMDGVQLFNGWISEVEYGYTENNGTFNLGLVNYTELLSGAKENLEQQKNKSYRQIIDWLLADFDYINVLFLTGGEENETVEKFDLGPTEGVITGIKRLISRKSWGVYTNTRGTLIIRNWKQDISSNAELLQGYNIKECKLNTSMKGLYKNYIVTSAFDKNKKESTSIVATTHSKDGKVKTEDTVPFIKARSENSMIDKNSISITKVGSSVSQEDADTIANNILNKAIAGRFVYKVVSPSFSDIRGNLFLPGDLVYIKSELMGNLDTSLLIRDVQMSYNFGMNGRAEYHTAMTLINKDFYANDIDLAQYNKSNKKTKDGIVHRAHGGDNG